MFSAIWWVLSRTVTYYYDIAHVLNSTIRLSDDDDDAGRHAYYQYMWDSVLCCDVRRRRRSVFLCEGNTILCSVEETFLLTVLDSVLFQVLLGGC